jgi:Leucine-rich repeat (LRR) protein
VCPCQLFNRLQSSQYLLLCLSFIPYIPVSNNLHTGFIPGEMGNMSNLRYFFASVNAFTNADIPDFLANLTKLEEIGLKSSNRFGVIPTFLGSLTDLVLLDLDDNTLFGVIPTEFGQLSKLEFLLLNRNQLTGEIPAGIQALTNLRVAFFDRNALNGTLAPMCDLATFNETVGDIDGTELITSDCLGPNFEVDCPCCTTCCNDLFGDCHDFFEVPSLDPIWEYRNNRLTYSFGNTSFFFSTDILP